VNDHAIPRDEQANPTAGGPDPESDPARSFGLAPSLRARLMGLGLAGLGLLLVVATLVVLLARLPLDILSVVVLLVLAGVFVLGFLVVRRWHVLELDRNGYRVRFVRGVGVAAARWSDVHDMVTSTVGGARCVVLRLRDGRSTTLPVDVVEGDSEELVRELGRRLSLAHGRRG
jgi:hypothetical protein